VSSNISTYTSTLPASNPFSAPTAHHGRQGDGYDYSSSEDDESYELQRSYTLTNPHGTAQGPYDPVHAASFGGDTTYHAPVISPIPTPLPATIRKPVTAVPTGDLAETSRSPPPPEPPVHASGTTGGAMGVQLTESHA
jgi:hypothetical protein